MSANQRVNEGESTQSHAPRQDRREKTAQEVAELPGRPALSSAYDQNCPAYTEDQPTPNAKPNAARPSDQGDGRT